MNVSLPKIDSVRVGVVGLGYVGLPLAVYMARRFPVVGFDIAPRRIEELREGVDRTHEVTEEEFQAAGRRVQFTADEADLKACNFFIVTVPTPIDVSRRPDLTALEKASATIGRNIAKGSVVVYESTVYPGATEEVCVPIIAKVSGLTVNRDFFVGYSPERINPGDLQHRLPSILKITSGSTPESADLIDRVYGRVITAGTHKASSIRVAEAAKVIENIQRDVNIALINELAMLFKQMGIETREVLAASGTKWNFHGYQPGLVGGHCIGVDPYYLTHKAQSIGFHTEMISAGRRINDGMAAFVARDIIRAMLRHKLHVDRARVLILGLTFKENVPDTRNTKVVDLVNELKDFVGHVDIYDPYADPGDVEHEYGLAVTNSLPTGPYDVVILAVKHEPILALGRPGIARLMTPEGMLYDMKGALPLAASQARLY
jgi:UDP-N-acetyl-D-galactosamine dehydrogenase